MTSSRSYPVCRDGCVAGLVGVILDITERKPAEEAQHRSEEEAKLLAQENSIMAEIGRIIPHIA